MTPKGNSSAIVLQVDVRKKEKRKKKEIAYLASSTLTNDRNEPTTRIKGGDRTAKKVS